MNKALFIILDGTLITTQSGKSFPLHSEDWKFTTKWDDLIRESIQKGYKIVLVDNQLSVGEGLVAEKNFIAKNEKICKIIEKDIPLPKNSIISTYCYKDNNPFMVKPNPGLLYEICLEYDIVLTDSILVGNSTEDEDFAKKSGIGTYYTLEDIKNQR